MIGNKTQALCLNRPCKVLVEGKYASLVRFEEDDLAVLVNSRDLTDHKEVIEVSKEALLLSFTEQIVSAGVLDEAQTLTIPLSKVHKILKELTEENNIN